MVSFSCEGCGDVLTKKKLDGHRNQCRGATFTCLDCMVHFWGTEYKSHTSCISEAQKYQGALYRPDKKGQQNTRNQNQVQQKQQPPRPTIQEVPETAVAVVSAPPAAPSPPSASPDFEAKPNVFDFYVGQATPNASVVDLANTVEPSAAVVKFSETAVQTPAKKSKKSKDSKAPATVEKSDKKRKRLHIDTSASPSVDGDIEMADAQADAVPVLHSGLTGGLVKMTTKDGFFPPTPDMSPDNEGEIETPVKRRKEGKRKSLEGNMGMALMRAVTGQKVKKAKKPDNSDERPKAKKAKAITANGEEEHHSVVAYAAPIEPAEMASMLLALVDKGEETQGVSMNKALKRYHRMRSDNGGLGKVLEEKELWKALRMKKNDRGEIVLFF